jgi:hypothetical protein
MPRGATAARLRAKWTAFYALNVYLPFSSLAGNLRGCTRTLRGWKDKHQPGRHLREISWRRAIASKRIHLLEPKTCKGNVKLGELAVLAKAAALVPPGQEIVEIGTFDGRTTLNLAVNSPPKSPVFTLDLPAKAKTKFALRRREREFIDKPISGERYRKCAAPWRDGSAKIVQFLGDSATYDWSAHYGKAGLVFVDGAHSYEYARHDSEVAFRLAAPRAMIIWHDYGIWAGVSQALDELESARRLGLRQLQGTSLVFWRAK